MCCFVGCVELITVRTPQRSVNVTKGRSVQLQCTFETTEQTGGLTIQWDFDSSSSVMPEQVDAHAAAQISALHHIRCLQCAQISLKCVVLSIGMICIVTSDVVTLYY